MVHSVINEDNFNEVEVIREDLRLIFDKASRYNAEYGFEVSMVLSIIGRQLNALYDLAEIIEDGTLQANLIDIIGEIELLLKIVTNKVNSTFFTEISDAIYTAKAYFIK